ncbi:MAG: hypothetical protein A2705_03110 [Omnitrophica WOR_2 bacterium RIFCSPHIGHO2_01_FULL_52_10]|nr:MAG: hypothetical protein A2705_03110 [Omnitrophica WOR_2 bacterium RIFCSPHIGHO2_01_FULL_52_10]
MQNKRKNPRHICTVPVDGQQGGPFESSKTIDFSQGGLGLISNHRISLNKEIAIQLDLSEEGQSALVVGKIQWVNPIAQTNNFRIGVVFKDMLQGSRTNVKDYLRLIT